MKRGKGKASMTDDQHVTIGDLKRELGREMKALVFAMHQRFDQIDQRLGEIEKYLGEIEADMKLVKAATHDRLEAEHNLADVRGAAR